MKFINQLKNKHYFSRNFFTMMFLFFVVIAPVCGQTTKNNNLSLNVQNQPLSEVFRQISALTDYKFFYDQNIVDKTPNITLNVRNVTIEDILDRITVRTKLYFYRTDNTISVSSTPLVNSQPVQQKQSRIISGIITDASGEPIIGANIVEEGTTNGTVTDIDGSFSLQVENGAILQISYIGYLAQDVNTAGKTTFNIVLQEDTKALEEVVVVGYGVQKKINLTGSVSSISGEDLKITSTNNLTNVLGGKLAGVTSVQSSGIPGEASNLSIRGYSTLNDNTPLIVVDGVVRSDGFGNIDPNEIESISILKDASAAAVYGARASNGVFLVTTKRGKEGAPAITYTGMVGVQQPTRYPKLMSAYEYAASRNIALQNQGYDPTNPAHAGLFYTEEQLNSFKPGITDWYDETFKKNSLQTQHNLSLTGGTNVVNYFTSLGYLKQDGMYDKINFTRYNLRANLDAKINSNLTMGLNIEGRRQEYNNPAWGATDIFNLVVRQSPIREAYWPSGRAANINGEHPVEMIKAPGYRKVNYDIFQGTLFFDQKLAFISPDLILKGSAAIYKHHMFIKHFVVPYKTYEEDENENIIATRIIGGETSLSETYEAINDLTVNLSLNYNKTIRLHDISGLLLYEQYNSKGNAFSATKKDFPTSIKDEFFASGPNNQSITGQGIINDVRRGLVGRFNYAFAHKYLLEATFRYDGSFRFPESKRFGFFPAFSMGWRISEETFFKNTAALSFVDNLKIRLSKGLIGNDRVNPYQFTDSYGIYSNEGPIFNNQPASYVAYGVYPNPWITWEKQDNNNIGLDASFWNQLLSFEFDYFFRNTRDILWTKDRSVPGTFGRSLPNENYAQMKSQGFEFNLSHKHRVNSVDYYLKLTGSYTTNKVTRIDDPANALDYQIQLNRPMGFRYGYRSLGLFRSQEEADSWYGGYQFGQKSMPGDIKYADINGDESITLQDQEVLSDYSNIPRIMYGFSGGITWKNVELNFLFQGAGQRNIFLSGSGRVMFRNGGTNNNFAYLNDSWSEENQNAKYPQAWIDSRLINDRNSNFWLRDASYLRLKSVDVGYTFKGPWLENMDIKQLRIYVSAFNLFTLSKMKEFDPEAATGTGDYYPQQRNINLGVSLSF